MFIFLKLTTYTLHTSEGVSRFLIGTSTQLGYTVPFMLDALESTGQKTNEKYGQYIN